MFIECYLICHWYVIEYEIIEFQITMSAKIFREKEKSTNILISANKAK